MARSDSTRDQKCELAKCLQPPGQLVVVLLVIGGLNSISAARIGSVSKGSPSRYVEETIAPIEQFGTVGRQLLVECTDPSIPNPCYASDGSFAICCSAQCGPFSDGYNPTCGRYGVDPNFNWGSTSARPMSTSGECPYDAPNPCFTADSSAGFCCGNSGCGPSGPNPVCNGDASISQIISTSNVTPSPTSTPASTPNPTAPTSTPTPPASTSTPSPQATNSPAPPPSNTPVLNPPKTSGPTSTPSPTLTNPPPTVTPTPSPTSAQTPAPTSGVNSPAPTSGVNSPATVAQNSLPNPTTATVSPGDKRTFVLHNLCPESIWIGIFGNADKAPATLASTGQTTTGFELGSQASAGVLTSSDWIGRFWARTRCGGSPFRCETGDCGGTGSCSGRTGEPPASLAEFALTQAAGQDYFDASLVDGYNLKLTIKPSNPSCPTVGCNTDLLVTCPEALKMRSSDGSRVIGCYSACSAPSLQTDPLHEQYCCSGRYAEDPNGCQSLHPDQYTRAFKAACPSAYSYAYDDPTSLFSCGQSNYDIYFCGDVPLTASTSTASSQASDSPSTADSPTSPPTNTPVPTPPKTSSPTFTPSPTSTNPPPTLTPSPSPTSAQTPAPTSGVNTPATVAQNPLPNPTTATVSAGDKRTFVLHNLCPESIWIGIFWNADKAPATLASTGQTTTGFELGSQASAGVLTSSDWIGRFWARTRCGGSPFRCETGDCGGSGSCSGRTGEPPASLAEFALTQAAGQDYFDASLVDGYNLKLTIKPSNPSCPTVGCNTDLLATCPEPLKMRSSDGSRVIGCYSACSAPSLQTDPLHEQYCCSGRYAEDSNGCQSLHPDQYTRAFKAACPSAYSYAYDDPTSLFSCGQSNYDIYFCGDVPLTA